MLAITAPRSRVKPATIPTRIAHDATSARPAHSRRPPTRVLVQSVSLGTNAPRRPRLSVLRGSTPQLKALLARNVILGLTPSLPGQVLV